MNPTNDNTANRLEFGTTKYPSFRIESDRYATRTITLYAPENISEDKIGRIQITRVGLNETLSGVWMPFLEVRHATAPINPEDGTRIIIEHIRENSCGAAKTCMLGSEPTYCMYLQPFRMYKFQVSGDIRGDGDFGDSPVVDLRAIVDNKTSAEEIIKGLACTALYRHANMWGESLNTNLEARCAMEVFTALCYLWLGDRLSNVKAAHFALMIDTGRAKRSDYNIATNWKQLFETTI